MTNDIDYEIFQYIDELVDKYVPFNKLLKQNNCSRSKAMKKVNYFKTDFNNLLKKYHIGSENAFMTYADLIGQIEKTPENRDLQYLYICMITDNGLLNEINSQNNTAEQNIRIYFSQTEKINELSDFLVLQLQYLQKIRCIMENLKKLNEPNDDFTEKSENLYQLTLQYNFIAESTVYRDNFNALLNYINGSEDTRLLKPYLIFAVLTRKHGMMQNRTGFIPNLKASLRYQKYNIYNDNGKNFNMYQSYIELYEQIKEIYADNTEVDIGLCDFCFAHTSPLSEWYYMWCEPDIDIPMSFRQKAELLKSLSFPMLHCYDDYLDTDQYDFETKHSKIYNSWEKYLMENPELLDDFFNKLYNNSSLTDCTEKLPESSGFSQYAGIFLYQEAETILNEKMLDTAELFTRI